MSRSASIWLVLAVSACGGGSGDESSSASSSETMTSLETGDGDGDPGDGDGDGTPELCEASPDWTSESMGMGRYQAIAVAPDDTLHLLRFIGDEVRHQSRPLDGQWSAEDVFAQDVPNFELTIRMQEHEGALAAVAEGSADVLHRDASGMWSVETDIAAVLGSGAPGIAFAPDGTLHATNGTSQLDPPDYGRKPPAGVWEDVPLPDSMSGGETTEVTVIDGVVQVCTVRYPSIECASSADGFATSTEVPSLETSRVALAGRWMVTASLYGSIDEPGTALAVARWNGTLWESVTSNDLPAFLGAIHVAEDAAGNLHVATASLETADVNQWDVRYMGVSIGGEVTTAWVYCGAQSIDVVGLSDGTPIVSYVPTAMGEGTYLASPSP